MSHSSAQLETDSVGVDDPRWELVERIVVSPSFIKSPRLCSFLRYICELTLQGRADEINELNIGEALFARAPNYDPSIDGIVRSHASRLRQRLEQYFSEEGAHESIRLSIPKGGYTPVFEPRPGPFVEEEIVPFPPLLTNVSAAVVSPDTATPAISTPWIVRALTLALTMACISIMYLVLHQRTGPIAVPVTATKHPLWSSLFGLDHPTMIVASDTGLTSLQTITGKNVKLAEYLNDDYRDHISLPGGTTIEVARTLASRRYTSIVDLNIVTKLYMLPGIPLNRIQVRYARDVRPNDFKSGPVIMLGAQEGTPWVELFEDRMNFVFRHDRQKHSFLVFNRSPQRNELSQYDSDQADPLHKVYGLIALQPNLEGSGQILLLEGTSMAGTESAADFIFDDVRLLPFLNKIKNEDGSLPYFELLLQSNNMNGNASKSEILAYRISSSSQSAAYR
ncbi:hypothetical protein FTO74_06355 [Granulicella sp. WH15]|uniref:hypothetical protein n=1 Tax=Granulicella sp. WH15 TaxID=2602070 RepID=UPI001366BD4F|nr:hypothetical protein [Granulicella sp. WH15]QHN03033.1 hypothetical protein FTO74_06355 [Granulicella sp. WH15]